MSDWAVGDLAVCVDVADRRSSHGVGTAGRDLVLGAVYRVSGVASVSSEGWAHDGTYLWLAERPDHTAAADRFRKIRPDKHEACEPEFVTLLKRTKVRA